MVLSFQTLVESPAAGTPAPPTPHRRRRYGRWIALVVAGLLLLFYGAGGWYFSGVLRSDALDPEAPGQYAFDIEVLSVGDGTVTLDGSSDNEHLRAAGLRGVAWAEGYATLGDVIAESPESVTRPITAVRTGALETGTLVDLDGFVHMGDPQKALGLAYETVTYNSPLGSMQAWHIPADGDAWIVLVHGKSAPLWEANRILPALNEAGLHSLVMQYRNDVGMAEDPSGFYRYGLTEWEDLEAAVQYTLDSGASHVAVGGFSMGGAIVMSFLRESPLAARVDAVVLDAPMLDFGATVDHQASDRTLPVIGLAIPQSLTSMAKIFSDWRFGVDWDRLDYLDGAVDYTTPTLIFHGTEDGSVPIEPSRAFAALQPDLVELIEVPGAGHVLSWNVDPESYEQQLVAFLGSLVE